MQRPTLGSWIPHSYESAPSPQVIGPYAEAYFRVLGGGGGSSDESHSRPTLGGCAVALVCIFLVLTGHVQDPAHPGSVYLTYPEGRSSDEHSLEASDYRGTSLTRKRTLLGTYSRPRPRVLGGAWGGGRFLMGEVPL